MADLLQEEIAPVVKVRIGKKSYPLAFPIAAVLLFKQKTGENLFRVDTWMAINSDLKEDDPQRYTFKLDAQEQPEKFLALLEAGLYGGLLLENESATPADIPKVGASVNLSNADRIGAKLVEVLVAHIAQRAKPEEESQPDPPMAESK